MISWKMLRRTPRSNCVLDTSKAERAGIGMRPVEEAVRESLSKMARRNLCEEYFGNWRAWVYRI